MARDWNSIMFDDIGPKIKKVARVVAWTQITFSIIGGAIMFLFALFNLEYLWPLLFFAPIIVCIGCLMAWLSVITMYGFGEIVHKVCSIDSKIDTAVQRLAQQDRTEAEAPRPVQQTQYTAPAPEPMVRRSQPKNETTQRPKPAPKPMPQTLSEKLAYALKFQTNDGMIRYLSTIDDGIVQNILQMPEYLIREAVEKTLENMQ